MRDGFLKMSGSFHVEPALTEQEAGELYAALSRSQERYGAPNTPSVWEISAGLDAIVPPLDALPDERNEDWLRWIVAFMIRRGSHIHGRVRYTGEDMETIGEYVIEADTATGTIVVRDQPAILIFNPDLFAARVDGAMRAGTPVREAVRKVLDDWEFIDPTPGQVTEIYCGVDDDDDWDHQEDLLDDDTEE